MHQTKSPSHTSDSNIRNFMKNNPFPTGTQRQNTVIHTSGIWKYSCCNTIGLQIHQKYASFSEAEIWNSYKCHSSDHREALMQISFLWGWNISIGSQKCISSVWSLTSTASTRLCRRINERAIGDSAPHVGACTLIGLYMSVLLNSGPVFHMHNRWLALCREAQTASAILQTRWLRISCVELL